MLSQRQKNIITIIFKNVDGIFGSDISYRLCVSTRTIRSDIKLINEYLKKYDCSIISSTQKGYYFKTTHLDIIGEVITTLTKAEHIEIDVNARTYLLLGEIMFKPPQSISELSDNIFVSPQTIYKDIKNLQKLSKSKINVDFIYIKNEIIYILADELLCRKFLFYIIKSQLIESQVLFPPNLLLLLKSCFNQDDFTIIQHFVSINFKPFPFIYDDSLFIIIWIFYLAKLRTVMGHHLTYSKPVNSINPKINIILNNFKNEFPDIDEFDISFLQNFLWTINGLSHPLSEISSIVVKEYTGQVLYKYGFNLNSAQEIINNLTSHIDFMLRRLSEGFALSNPIINDIKKQYFFSYEIAMLMVPIIYSHKQQYLSEDEISYIAIYNEHFLQNFNKKIPTLIIINNREGIISLTKAWIYKHFSNQLDILDVIPLHKLDETLLTHDISLIISMVDISKKLCISSYIFQGLPSEDDKLRLKYILKQIRINTKSIAIIDKKFNENCILFLDNSISFDEIILTLSNKLEKYGAIENAKIFKNLILQREKQYPTIMQGGIMIPHLLQSLALENSIAVAVLPASLKHTSKDIRLIFLLATKPTFDDDMNHLFGFFKKLSENMDAIKCLSTSTNSEVFLQKLRDYFINLN